MLNTQQQSQAGEEPRIEEVRSEQATGESEQEAHSCEILQGVFRTADHRLTRGLTTLSNPLLKSQATVELNGTGNVHVSKIELNETGNVHVPLQNCTKAKRAGESTLGYLRLDGYGCQVTLRSNIRSKLGCGASTADCTATIRAVAHAAGRRLADWEVGLLAVQAEGASDNTMFIHNGMLWAHREGRIIEKFDCCLPAMLVLAFNTDPSGEGVPTDQHPRARYSSSEIELFGVLWNRLRKAVKDHDAPATARIATISGGINQQFLPTKNYSSILEIQRETSALGVAIAHSGLMAALLFDPGMDHRAAEARRLLSQLVGKTELYEYTI